MGPYSAIAVWNRPEGSDGRAGEEHLTALVLDAVTSPHSRRSYRTGLERFFAWVRTAEEPRAFSKALAGRYRAHLLQEGRSAATVNLRLAPIRRLAREMADNGLLEPAAAAAIERVPGVERRGARAGNWLTKEQANELLNAPDPATLAGKRDRAILALLLVCGLRRAELVNLDLASIQQRDARWVIPDLLGKGGRLRLVTVPAGVKARIDLWTRAAALTEGRLFRPVTKGGHRIGAGIRDEKAVWRLVLRYARETGLGRLAPHDLRRTCAKLCRRAGGDLEQIQLLLGHASVQTTERYLGTEQNLAPRGQRWIGIGAGMSNAVSRRAGNSKKIEKSPQLLFLHRRQPDVFGSHPQPLRRDA